MSYHSYESGHPLDRPENPATPETVERVAQLAMIKARNQGFYVSLTGDRQADVEAIDKNGVIVPISIVAYEEPVDGLICQVSAARDLIVGRTRTDTNYNFYDRLGEIEVERFSHFTDEREIEQWKRSFLAGDGDKTERMRKRYVSRVVKEAKAEEFARRIGDHIPTEAEMRELEQLILTGRVY